MKKGVLTKEDNVKILESLRGNPEEIDKNVSLSWDGKNLLLRLPKDIAEYFGVNNENRFEKKVRFIVRQKKDGTTIKEFDIINRTEPKREVKKGGKKEG